MLEQESLVVIVVSTTGDGEPPDTALKFWRRIKRKTLAKDYFSNVRYSLLGKHSTFELLYTYSVSWWCKCFILHH